MKTTLPPSTRLEFLACLLDESVRLGREQCRAILAPLPPTLVMQLVKVQPQTGLVPPQPALQVQPDRFPLSTLARLTDNSTGTGRKTTAR